jgi:hypothetical protein
MQAPFLYDPRCSNRGVHAAKQLSPASGGGVCVWGGVCRLCRLQEEPHRFALRYVLLPKRYGVQITSFHHIYALFRAPLQPRGTVSEPASASPSAVPSQVQDSVSWHESRVRAAVRSWCLTVIIWSAQQEGLCTPEAATTAHVSSAVSVVACRPPTTHTDYGMGWVNACEMNATRDSCMQGVK